MDELFLKEIERKVKGRRALELSRLSKSLRSCRE